MNAEEIKILRCELQKISIKVNDIHNLLKDDQYGNPGLVTQHNLSKKLVQVIEQRLCEKIETVDKEVKKLEVRISELYNRAIGVIGAIALVVSILMLILRLYE